MNYLSKAWEIRDLLLIDLFCRPAQQQPLDAIWVPPPPEMSAHGIALLNEEDETVDAADAAAIAAMAQQHQQDPADEAAAAAEAD